jgi:hypothetical protein
MGYKLRIPWPRDDDPNRVYRPWLEKNVGEQKKMWDWDMAPDLINMVEVVFVQEEHAILFALSI